MAAIPLEALSIKDTPCGRVCLNLSACVGWREFPGFARELMSLCGGIVRQKADAEEIRVWRVVIADSELHLVFQESPAMVLLESADPAGDLVLRGLFDSLGRGE